PTKSSVHPCRPASHSASDSPPKRSDRESTTQGFPLSDSSPPKTRRSPETMGILTLAAGASIYALLVVVASMGTGARGWGVHAAGFLPPGIRLLLLAALLAAAVLLWMTALQAHGTP